MIRESVTKNALLLAMFSLVTTAIIAATYLGTKQAISDNIRKAEEKALLQIVPRTRHNNSMLQDSYLLSNSDLLGLREAKKAYVAKQDGVPVAVIIPATAREGYTGDIDMIVGINTDGSLAGVRIISHKETPGLGDKVDYKKSQWVDVFVGKSLKQPEINQWKVKKDKGSFDQFTGATITPRAVVKTVKQSLEYFEANRAALLNQGKPVGSNTPSRPNSAAQTSSTTNRQSNG